MNFWDIFILVAVLLPVGWTLLRLRRKKRSGCAGCCHCCGASCPSKKETP